MLSRVAEAIYWTSRYVERAENVARFVDVNLNLTMETPLSRRDSWEPLVLTTGDQDWFRANYSQNDARDIAWFLTFDRAYPNSVISAVSRARDNAQTVREVISREMWQELNEFYLMVKAAGRQRFSLEDMSEFYQRVKLMGVYYEGVTNATLSRGEAWHFARLGRNLERADKTSRILDVKYYVLLPTPIDVGTAADQLGWVALLNSASALQMYRQDHHLPTPPDVARFLLLSRRFPRAILYCVTTALRSVHAITGTRPDDCRFEVERLVGRLQAQLGFARIEEIMDYGLHEYIDELQVSLNRIGDATAAQFFAH